MTTLGLIVPLGHEVRLPVLRRLVADRVVDSLWVRDLPAVPTGDDDVGQGSDPWWFLGRLIGAEVLPARIGTASIVLGVRHPLVVARAATAAQVDSGGRFLLGVGTGGKPAMNRALGVAGRSRSDFAAEWALLRSAVRTGAYGEVSLDLPQGYRPPPMYLATSDPHRWAAIGGDADGWQTFLTDDIERFRSDHAQISGVRGESIPVDLRLDAALVDVDDAAPGPRFTHPARGRVRCSAVQLAELVRPWLGDPVGRILIRLSGQEPEIGLRRLSAALATKQ